MCAKIKIRWHRMKIGKKLKRDTIIVIVSVFVLTLTTIRVSYAAFFTVKSQSTMQKLSTGNLEVLINKEIGSKSITLEEMMPTPNSELPTYDSPNISKTEGSYATITFMNSGDYAAEFALSITYDSIPSEYGEEDLIPLKWLKIGIYDKTTNSWINYGTDATDNAKYYVSLSESELEPNGENNFTILNGTVNKTESKNYEIYVWLDQDAPTEVIGKLVYLKLNIDSRTLNDGDDWAVGD